MDQTKFSCGIESTDASCPMGLEIWLDDLKIFDQAHITDAVVFEHLIEDTESQHELRFVLKNKPADYTQVDANGNIVKDSLLLIKDIAFDEIALGHMITEQSVYTHNINGSGDIQQDKFYGLMGCNGTVSLKFSTPIYLWLLEHM